MNELNCIGAQLWDKVYDTGGNSGEGSYGKSAIFKARVINEFVKDHKIRTVVEFGCGDGNQLSLAEYDFYQGYDVSPTAIERCRRKFDQDKTKRFNLVSEYKGQKSQLAMSLDVLYHIIESEVWEAYLNRLFNAARDYVIIYSTDDAYNAPDRQPHMMHRKFTPWVEEHQKGWKLIKHVPNECGYNAHFYIYGKI